MARRRPRTLSQTGDTIIEVMIVLAILGLAIAVVYSTANRSLLNARQAQETAYAAELVRSQVEGLHILSGNHSPNPNYIFNAVSPNNTFCIDNAGNVQRAGFASPFNALNIEPPSDYPAACAFDGGNYSIAITYTNPSTTPSSPDDTFTVKAVWNDVVEGLDSSTYIYRIHEAPL